MKNKICLSFAYLCFISAIFTACQKNEANPEAMRVSEVSQMTTQPPVTPIETLTSTDKIALGKMLFWDPILSGKKDVACATCHHPAHGYSDNLDLSIGVNATGLGANRHFLTPNNFPFAKRNSQTVLNTVFNGMDVNGNFNPLTAPMFWDSRAQSLELQSLEPIKSLEEMRANAYAEAVALDSVIARLRAIPIYQTLFRSAFGTGQVITINNLGSAIAAFERTLTANNYPYDRYQRGERNAMTNLEIQGMNAFQNAGCAGCHTGNMFSDYQLHVLSVPDNTKSLVSDAGANGTYAFRTASLRNLRFTAPYMHDGVFQTLNQVLQFYGNIAGGQSQNPHVTIRQVDPKIRDVRIRQNQGAIIAFINALSDENFDKSVPTSVPSKLNPGGSIR